MAGSVAFWISPLNGGAWIGIYLASFIFFATRHTERLMSLNRLRFSQRTRFTTKISLAPRRVAHFGTNGQHPHYQRLD